MNSINYNVTGEKRKALVRAMSEILGEDAVYQGAPSFAYIVDGWTISRNGAVTAPASTAREKIDDLIAALCELGFVPKDEDNANIFTVEMPRAGFSEEAYCFILAGIKELRDRVLRV